MPSSVVGANLPLRPATIRPIAGPTVAQPPIYVVRGRPGPLDRPALPSGHAESWGAITHGTLLDQSLYPFPIFQDLPR
jgi:hypothetical protein